MDRSLEAEEELRRANHLDGHSADILYALAVYYIEKRDWTNAYKFASELRKQHPELPATQNLLDRINRETGH
jgi:predicted Zn-dependent protease